MVKLQKQGLLFDKLENLVIRKITTCTRNTQAYQ